MHDQSTFIAEITAKLNAMWARIEYLRTNDPFAAQVLYEKYKKLGDELAEIPPDHSHIVEDQCVS